MSFLVNAKLVFATQITQTNPESISKCIQCPSIFCIFSKHWSMNWTRADNFLKPQTIYNNLKFVLCFDFPFSVAFLCDVHHSLVIEVDNSNCNESSICANVSLFICDSCFESENRIWPISHKNAGGRMLAYYGKFCGIASIFKG